MTSTTDSPAPEATRFTVEHYAAFWDAPAMNAGGDVLAADIVGDWPGDDGQVVGLEAYSHRLAWLLERVPDLRLDVLDHAQNGEVIFIHWLATGTGADGPFEVDGVDRIKLDADGRVRENVIRYDARRFDEALGQPTSPA